MSKRIQPEWTAPSTKKEAVLKLYNSLSRKKEVFVPLGGNNVTWYSCGPTVYDAAHMGHARSYISFDILRRVLADYFGYNVKYVMNITDIDDKIIKRARQNYLYEKYTSESASMPLNKFLEQQKDVLLHFESICSNNTDSDKIVLLNKTLERMRTALSGITEAVRSNFNRIEQSRLHYLLEAKDPISEWLDLHEGANVTDNSLFDSLPRYWENHFHLEMKALNVLPPDVLTRVSEYIPQIIAFIEKIIQNNFAYTKNGSVYFNVNAFNSSEKHFYAKLIPEAFGDTRALQDGEGDLSISQDKLSEKQSENDFALWKASKAGEPHWDSPWGQGRPGWHIECSAMASDIFGSIFDIHTGGVDLKFPHHDNELAQSEAAFNCSEWVKYFLHTGHLTISGCKMSKSLKNFITIKEALLRHSPTQLRIAFLLHSWKDTLDYSDSTMDMAKQFEQFLNEFFLNVKDLTRRTANENPNAQFDKWHSRDADLEAVYNEAREKVHQALCDNIDTRSALDAIRELVSSANKYTRDSADLNRQLLKRIAIYITKLMRIFGAISSSNEEIGFSYRNSDQAEGINAEEIAMPYVETIAEYRKEIREQAKLIKAVEILKLSDKLRDNILPNLGVRLEDKDGGKYAIKFVNRDFLLKEKEAKEALLAAKLAEKEQNIKKQNAPQNSKNKCIIDLKKMFLQQTDKYSKFDENGLPTHDNDGKEISKSHQKKLLKLQQKQSQINEKL